MARELSPLPGRSSFTTSAPMSARIMVQNGPAMCSVMSSTLTPARGPPPPVTVSAIFVSSVLPLVQRRHPIAVLRVQPALVDGLALLGEGGPRFHPVRLVAMLLRTERGRVGEEGVWP